MVSRWHGGVWSRVGQWSWKVFPILMVLWLYDLQGSPAFREKQLWVMQNTQGCIKCLQMFIFRELDSASSTHICPYYTVLPTLECKKNEERKRELWSDLSVYQPAVHFRTLENNSRLQAETCRTLTQTSEVLQHFLLWAVSK